MFSFENHFIYGSVNSFIFHGRQAPCTCSNPDATALQGIPDECQWQLLVKKSHNFSKFPSENQGRFRAYKEWARLLGIWGIRVKPPACVLDGVSSTFGHSATGFICGPNNCKCETCVDEKARALFEALNPESSDSENDGEDAEDVEVGAEEAGIESEEAPSSKN
jgi:hypothetical protein